MNGLVAAPEDVSLVRAIGVRQLAAGVFNMIVGAGIFLLPGSVAAKVGSAAPLAYLLCAVAVGLVMVCFAMAGSRVTVTGGPYAYAEAAFGPLTGFLTGFLYWSACVLGVAAVANGFASSVIGLMPSSSSEPLRLALLASIISGVAFLNVRGVRHGAAVVEVTTLVKILPLIFFVAFGLAAAKPEALRWPSWPRVDLLGQAVLSIFFAFMGGEAALQPSEEIRNPERTIPRSIFSAMAAITLLYLGIHLATQGALGNELSDYEGKNALTEAAGRFLGPSGALMIALAAAVSMFGYVSGDLLASPRMFLAFGRKGFLPAWLARIHPRHRTPSVAIGGYATLVFAIAASARFQRLADLCSVMTLLVYLVCCLAAWKLQKLDVRGSAAPFQIRGVRVVPWVAAACVVWILSQASAAEFGVAGGVAAVGFAIYGLRQWRLKRING